LLPPELQTFDLISMVGYGATVTKQAKIVNPKQRSVLSMMPPTDRKKALRSSQGAHPETGASYAHLPGKCLCCSGAKTKGSKLPAVLSAFLSHAAQNSIDTHSVTRYYFP
jgi:hypothetical protein